MARAHGHARLIITPLLIATSLYLVTAELAQTVESRPAFQYTGPGSCSASACHGSIQPRTETSVNQNEYSVWVTQDKHARAFSALSSPLSQRMARNLGLKQSPEAAAQCLNCHALDVPATQRTHTFDLTDGVTCESCHGPAAAWLGEHTARNWRHEQSVARGMYDTKDLTRRPEKCLSCHLGNAEKSVNHEMLAAGHPLLTFELDSYSAVMPRHWKTPQKDAWLDVRTWSVGQAVQLRETLAQLARRARSQSWPEYAELDCYSCHHALVRPEESWRQQSGFAGRRPGTPPWDAAQYAVLLLLLEEVNPEGATQLDTGLKQLSAQMNQLIPERDQVAASASRSSQLSGVLARQLQAFPYDQATTLRMLRKISASAGPLSNQGERTAEQAAMAMNSLFLPYARNQHPASEAQMRELIDGLYKQLANPSAYNPRRFAEQLQKAKQLLP